MPRLPLIYIAGPFRGPTPLDVRRNVEAARDVGLLVAQAGGYPIIPHTMTAEFDKQLDDQFWLDGTMALLARCDAIYLTSDWRSSQGATTERQFALDHAMPCFEHGRAESGSWEPQHRATQAFSEYINWWRSTIAILPADDLRGVVQP